MGQGGWNRAFSALRYRRCCPTPVLHVVAQQLLAYHVALVKGTDVDKPRNLAKSVTVE